MGIKPRTREYKIQESEDVRVRHGIPNKVNAGKLSAFLTVVVICLDFSSLPTCKPFAPQSMLGFSPEFCRWIHQQAWWTILHFKMAGFLDFMLLLIQDCISDCYCWLWPLLQSLLGTLQNYVV